MIAVGAALVVAAVEPRWRRPALVAGSVALGLQTAGAVARLPVAERRWIRAVPEAGGLVALLSLVREADRAERWESGWSDAVGGRGNGRR